jgi:glucans biosynthesis protein C
MEITLNQKTERQYFIDWLRILLILSVFLFHIGMIFNTWSWHIKNDVHYGGILKYSMIFLHNWRMPLLFMLSGAGTWFALGKRTPRQYIKERFMRLFLPFIVGVFTLVPIQVYIEKISGYSSLINFYTHMFDGVYPSGNFSWHHLWFILYLFFIAILITPFLNFLRSKKVEGFRTWCNSFFTKPFAIYLVIVLLVFSQVLLRPFFETETNSFYNDWASITYYLLFFIAGFFLLTSGVITESLRRYRFIHLASTVMSAFIMFIVAGLIKSERTSEIVWDVASVSLAWSCSITAIGFAKQHLNFNSRLRGLANEAIYPFYLLHQPIIVVTGYLIINMDLPDIFKFTLILIIALLLTASIYWFLIRPYNFMRFIFGMKYKEPVKETAREEVSVISEDLGKCLA